MTFFAQAFPFLHPTLALFALAAGLLPVLIHFINRRRYRQAPWAAMSFLLSANQRSRKRLRMEHWLLMLIRIAAIVLLGLAVARPFVSAAPLGGLGSSRMHRVLILDNSISMLAQADQKDTRFAIALRAADELLARLPDGDVVSIITTSAPAEAIIEYPASDRRVVRERVQSVPPLPKPADWIRAINLAREILRDSPLATGNQGVHVVSDFRRGDWLDDAAGSAGGSGTPSPAAAALRRLAEESGPGAPGVHAIRVNDDDGANVGVSELVMESALLTPRLPARAIVHVVNHSRAAQRGLVLQFRRGGQVLRRETVPDMAAGQSATVTASLEFAGAGTHLLEVALEGASHDVLKIDDTRYLSVEVREKVAALLVDGHPGPTPLSGQAGYLAKALQPLSGVLGGVEPNRIVRGPEVSLVEAKVVGAAELGSEVLGDYDVIALCDVARLSGGQWEPLRAVVARGTGLLIFAGDQLSVEHYNEFGRADAAPLLPGTLSPATTLGARPDAPGGIKLAERIHPIVAEFARFPDSGLFGARVDKYMPLAPNAAGSEVVLRFSDGAPALVVGAHGLGRVAFVATTANMAWNNLPAKGDFVSLMLNVTAFLAPQRGSQRNLLAGETLREPISAGESGLLLRVITADGESHEPRLTAEQGTMYLAHGPIETVGPLVIAVGGQQRAGCVNVDGQVLEMFTADRGSLQSALGAGVTMSDARAGGGTATSRAKTTEVAKPFFVIAGVLLALEMWMAMHFGVRYTKD